MNKTTAMPNKIKNDLIIINSPYAFDGYWSVLNIQKESDKAKTKPTTLHQKGTEKPPIMTSHLKVNLRRCKMDIKKKIIPAAFNAGLFFT